MMRAPTFAVLAFLSLLNATALAQSPRVLSATRDLFIDATRADLTRVTRILVARNGDMIIPQWEDSHVRFFDAQGTSFTFGRAGDGPNEFRNIREYGFVGDTLWLADIAHSRITYVAPTRAPLRTVDYTRIITTATASGPHTWSASYPVAVYPDGSRLIFAGSLATGGSGAAPGGRATGAPGAAAAAAGRTAAPPPPAPARARSAPPQWWTSDSAYARPMVKTTADGQFIKVVVWAPRIPDCGVRFQMPSGGAGNAFIPFCASLLEAVSHDGDRVAQIIRTTATATTGSYRLVVLSANADTIVSRTIPFRPVAIPKAKNDSVIALRLEEFGARPGFGDAYRSMTVRTHYPPVRSILIGRDKTIWLELWTPTAERSWQVLDARGNLVAAVKFPANVTIHAAEMTAAWGIESDVDGLISLVRYKLQ